jgi:shikimate dehydrogenase
MSGAARLAGVVGWPIAQSLSPLLHGHWLAEHGIDGTYVPLPVKPEDFAAAMEDLRRKGFRGINVTVPHKEAAFTLTGRHDRAASISGAVNLLLFGDGGTEGRNTDGIGLAAALKDGLGPDCVKDRAVVIWGAGGTARAAVYALSRMGAAEIRILNRTVARAEALVGLGRQLSVKVTAGGYESWPEAGKDARLLVHTTSAGMKQTPSLDLPLDVLPQGAAVFDAVYNPLETGLLKCAKARGLRTVDGLGMLMHQAVPSFAAFFGVEPAVTPALRSKLEKALSGG